MDPLEINLPETDLTRAAREVAARLREAGHAAYFVGGCVRNALLGQPVHDVDIATDARPEAIAALFERTEAVGASFGVMLVRHGGHTFEVATFRREGRYLDFRHPSEVSFGTLEQDHRRRDFTINAMYWDPASGELIDLAGGREDLAARRLRTVGEPGERFSEDALRLMRAVRFAVRFGLELDPATAGAIRDHAALLAKISVERVAGELVKILTGPHRGRAMWMLLELGLWPYIIPEVVAMRGCDQPPQFHPEGDVFTHTALVLDALDDVAQGEPEPELALAALLHDIGKPPTAEHNGDRMRFPRHQVVGARMAGAIARRLKLSNEVIDRTEALVADHMKFMDVQKMKRAKQLRFVGQPFFDLHLKLHYADCTGSHGKLGNYEFCQDLIAGLRAKQAEGDLLPPPLIDGRDLIALGLEPGPRFKELLDAVRDEQLEGRLESKDAALEWLRVAFRIQHRDAENLEFHREE